MLLSENEISTTEPFLRNKIRKCVKTARIRLNSSFKLKCCPGVLPYIGYIGICVPEGYGLSAVLVINRVSILVILVINKVRFLHSNLDYGMCL